MSKKIMVVDDSSTVRMAVAAALTEAGYSVVEAVDGRDGLDKLKADRVNLIISDVNMPNMDGIAMIKEVKELPNYKFTPVIMLTTESGQKVKDMGKEAGVKAWMVKPFKPDQMVQAVKTLLI